MQVNLDEEFITNAIDKHINKAVEEALGSYKVQSGVADVLQQSVVSGAIGEALKEAVAQLDQGKIVHVLAGQIVRSMTSAVVHIVNEGLVSIMLDLRKIPDYDREKRLAEHDKLIAMLKKES